MRLVLASDAVARNGVRDLVLECGHTTRRRHYICEPQRVLCPHCPGA
jgi:hypothetical protein